MQTVLDAPMSPPRHRQRGGGWLSQLSAACTTRAIPAPPALWSARGSTLSSDDRGRLRTALFQMMLRWRIGRRSGDRAWPKPLRRRAARVQEQAKSSDSCRNDASSAPGPPRKSFRNDIPQGVLQAQSSPHFDICASQVLLLNPRWRKTVRMKLIGQQNAED